MTCEFGAEAPFDAFSNVVARAPASYLFRVVLGYMPATGPATSQVVRCRGTSAERGVVAALHCGIRVMGAYRAGLCVLSVIASRRVV